jgi:hypothetical protein
MCSIIEQFLIASRGKCAKVEWHKESSGTSPTATDGATKERTRKIMGTRSLTVVMDQGKEIVCMYRQFDGYPSGLGQELRDFLSKRKIVNGFSAGDSRNFNGIGCLAAQVVAHFKKGIGNVYLYAPGTRDVGEEYVYTITRGRDGGINLQVQECGAEMKVLYSGPVEGFDAAKVEVD